MSCVLPASPLACTQRSAYVRRGLPASTLASREWSVAVKRGPITSSVNCSHQCVNIECGLRTSSLSFIYLYVDVEFGLPTLNIDEKYRSLKIGQRHTTSSKARENLTWHVCIWKVKLPNGMHLQQSPSHTNMECAYHEREVVQWHKTSSKHACANVHVHI